MSIYKATTPEVMKTLSKYKKPFEEVVISEPAMLSGHLYREVVFEKKLFSKFRENPKEYMYLNDNNEVVDHKNTVERLGRLFFYMDAFYNNDKESIIGAFQKEGDLERNTRDFDLARTALEILDKKEFKNTVDKKDKKSKVEAKEVKEVKGAKEEKQSLLSTDTKAIEYTLNNLGSLRMKTNEKLKILLKKIEEEKEKNEYFNELMVEVLSPYYRDVMILNYEKIQLISKETYLYNSVKKKAEKARKSYTLRFNTRNTEALMKLHYLMGYFENLLGSYNNIATMSYNQYLRLINNAGKTNAEYKLLALRNKVQ
jgi:hypothetical protein